MDAKPCPNCGLRTGHVRGCLAVVVDAETVASIPSRHIVGLPFGHGGRLNRLSPEQLQNTINAEKPTAEEVRAADYARGVSAALSGTYDSAELWLETLAFKRGYWQTNNGGK